MGQHKCQRHIFLGLVGGITEHEALVAGAVKIKLVLLPCLKLEGFINAKSNIGRLFVNSGHNPAGVPVKSGVGTVISDFVNYLSGD